MLTLPGLPLLLQMQSFAQTKDCKHEVWKNVNIQISIFAYLFAAKQKLIHELDVCSYGKFYNQINIYELISVRLSQRECCQALY